MKILAIKCGKCLAKQKEWVKKSKKKIGRETEGKKSILLSAQCIRPIFKHLFKHVGFGTECSIVFG